MTDEEIYAMELEYRKFIDGWLRELDPKAVQYAVDTGYIKKASDVYDLEWMNLAIMDGKYQKSIGNPVEEYWWMTRIPGSFKDIRIVMGSDEDVSVPHFHFYRATENPCSITNKAAGGGCVCIMEEKYLAHGSHDDIMDSGEIEGLMGFLRSMRSAAPNREISKWHEIIHLWNNNNPTLAQISYDQPIPDYRSDMPCVRGC